MAYEAKDFDNLLGTEGFSDELLKNHFTLYRGYVTNTNMLADVLGAMVRKGMAGTPEYAELKRRFGWEWNGMRLHEYYFGNMTRGGKAIDENTDFYKKIVDDFGSYENWEKDFRAVGSMRGIGWAVLYYDDKARKLFNSWINEHDTSHPCGASPVLAMDVFEHAYMLDYGVKKAGYIDAFFNAIDWSIDITMERSKLPLVFGKHV